jgi:hypothetical protein
MKKFLVAGVVLLTMLAESIPASADNSEEVIIGILGGALGGLIIGEAIGNGNRVYAEPQYYLPPPVVYEEYVEPAPVRCVYKKKRVYSPEADEYLIVKKRVCYR